MVGAEVYSKWAKLCGHLNRKPCWFLGQRVHQVRVETTLEKEEEDQYKGTMPTVGRVPARMIVFWIEKKYTVQLSPCSR